MRERIQSYQDTSSCNPPPGTYVIQIPKDQIYRIPPEENAKRYEQLSRGKIQKKKNRACCRGLFTILLLLCITAGILYVILRPKSPNYSLHSVSVKNLNLTASTPISPQIDVTVRADNPNKNIQIYYHTGSSVNLYYNDVRFCNGVLPVFQQRTDNVTDFVTVLTGSGILLNNVQREALIEAQGNGTVPLRLDLTAPVKMKAWSLTTWTLTVKVICDMVIDKLTTDAKFVSNNCGYRINIW